MSANPEPPWLLALSAAISDGTPVDWDEASRHAMTAAEQQLVKQLRNLANIVSAQRSAGGSEGPPTDIAVPRHWRHLVLFESVGVGAFGTVYRGWDSQLEREVALKLLPISGERAGSPLEEARHLARIRHPSVVVVYGADEDVEQVGIWMEFIEGQTLSDVVRERGPMSPREVTGIGIDLCRALSALHASSLLHRDIKPHNVMREVGGRIVLMDFSGAEAIVPPEKSAVFSGTPLYMAPELLEGAAATVATDVYSLGVLLFYLLSAEVPVVGATVADLREAHSRRERRRLRDLRPDAGDAIVNVIERAMAPDPRNRYQTAGELEHALATGSGVHAVYLPAEGGPAHVSPRLRYMPPERVWVALTLVLAAFVGMGAIVLWPKKPAPELSAHFTIGPPYNSGSWPRLSPDGRFVAFGALVDGRDQFWIRGLNDPEGHALERTTAKETPFWSPDGRALCFFAEGQLRRISVDGGEPETLTDAPAPHGGDWNTDGVILFAREGGVFRINADGAGLARLTTVDLKAGEFQHAWPFFLPDRRHFLFLVRGNQERSGVYVGALDSSAPRRIMAAYSRMAYADGRLLYVRDGNLMAQGFDPVTASLKGNPTWIAGGVKHHPGGDAAFDVSPNGVLIFERVPSKPTTRLMVMDRHGREVDALTASGTYREPRFSPDGTRVAVERVDADLQNPDIWIYDIASKRATRLTNDLAPDVKPVWSPDGRRIAFSSRRGQDFDIFVKSVDSTGPEERIDVGPGDKYVEHWSPDGRFLSGTLLKSGLWIVPLEPGQKPWPVRRQFRNDTWQSEFSPDGRWLAYMSKESGNPEVYVEPFPTTGARWHVSTRGGAEPHWRPDGSELYYLATDGMVMVVPATAGGWSGSKPDVLFRISVPDIDGTNDYTVSPSGELFVVNKFLSDPVVPPIHVLVNWTSQVGIDARSSHQ